MTYLKDFYFDNEQILVPSGTKKVYDAGNWALYHNELPHEDFTLIVTKGSKSGRSGWRVRQFAGIMQINHASNFVKTHCSGCLGLNND
jgi:hypothetical protein